MTRGRQAIRQGRRAVGGLLAAWLLATGVLATGLLATRPAEAAVEANTATAEQLDRIRGIGPALSARIVAERAKGPFRDLADLQQRVRGIGPATAARLAADGLTVNGSGAVRTPETPPKPREVAGSAARGPVAGPAAAAGARTPVGRGTVIDTRVDAPGRVDTPAQAGPGASTRHLSGASTDRTGPTR